jgi:hypothetical protein
MMYQKGPFAVKSVDGPFYFIPGTGSIELGLVPSNRRLKDEFDDAFLMYVVCLG